MSDDFPAELMSPPEYDSSDPEQVAMAERAGELRLGGELEMVRRVVSTYEGRAFISMLLQETGLRRSSFVGEFPMTMARNEGRREIGIWGEDLVFTVAPEMYNMMRREAVDREYRYARDANLNQEG